MGKIERYEENNMVASFNAKLDHTDTVQIASDKLFVYIVLLIYYKR